MVLPSCHLRVACVSLACRLRVAYVSLACRLRVDCVLTAWCFAWCLFKVFKRSATVTLFKITSAPDDLPGKRRAMRSCSARFLRRGGVIEVVLFI
jgi:hypothetical protein